MFCSQIRTAFGKISIALVVVTSCCVAQDTASRMQGLDRALSELKSARLLTPEAAFWLPTLALYRENASRGYAVRRLDEKYVPSQDYRLDQIGRAEELVRAFRGKDFSKLYRPGGIECAFFSRVDGSLSPYVLYLPEDYVASRARYRLILYLHGTNGTQWEVDRSTAAFPRAQLARCKWILAVPLARGNSGYRGPAEKDVVQLAQELSKTLRIDPAKRAISGFSAGAIGSWRLALDYPKLFDAVIPMCGILPWHVKDVPNLQKLVEATLPKSEIPRDPTAFGEPERDPATFENLRGHSVIVVASIDDPVIPFELSTRVTAQLKARSIPFELVEFERRHSIYPGILGIYDRLQ